MQESRVSKAVCLNDSKVQFLVVKMNRKCRRIGGC